MSEYNIQMNKYNALNAEYDQLYPATKIKNVDGLNIALQKKADLGADGKVPESQLPSMGYSKSETLSDTTKTLFGLDATAVPDDVFALLSRFHKGLGNEYVWAKCTSENQYIIGSENQSRENVNADGNTIAYYATSYTYDEKTGTYNLVNPTSGGVQSIADQLTNQNNYFKLSDTPDNIIYKGSGSGYSQTGSTYTLTNCLKIVRDVTVIPAGTVLSYVNSPDPNAYPPAVSDGYTYTALGQLGSAARVEILTYTGADQTTKTITFSNTPKIVLIFTNRNNTTYYVPSVYVWGYPRIFKAKTGASGTSYNGLSETYYMVKATTSGNSLTLEYTTDPSYNLFNDSFETYTVVAIG